MPRLQHRPYSSGLSPIEKLPVDVVDRLLLYLTDYYSLRSSVLAAFVFYDVYTSRCGSIRLAVCQNEVGPAWPQALSLVKSQLAHEENQGCEEFLTKLSQLFTGENTVVHTITEEEAWALVKVSSTARRLEHHFSIRVKDVSAATPLDYVESLRFQRALYRFWMFKPVSVTHRFPSASQLWLTLPRQEFLEITSVYIFCRDLLEWLSGVGNVAFFPAAQVHHSTPDEILRMFDDQTLEPVESDIHLSTNTDIQTAFRDLCNSKSISMGDGANPMVILTSLAANVQTCDRCLVNVNIPLVDPLWGEPNWHWLKGVFRPEVLLTFLPGHLSANIVQIPPLCDLLRSPNLSYALLMKDLFDKSKTEGGLDSSWSSTKWYCRGCLVDPLRYKLFSWCLSWRIDGIVAGEKPMQEDCWHGWNCRTQRHSRHHAGRLNHLCPPSRESDTTPGPTPPAIAMPVIDVDASHDALAGLTGQPDL